MHPDDPAFVDVINPVALALAQLQRFATGDIGGNLRNLSGGEGAGLCAGPTWNGVNEWGGSVVAGAHGADDGAVVAHEKRFGPDQNTLALSEIAAFGGYGGSSHGLAAEGGFDPKQNHFRGIGRGGHVGVGIGGIEFGA